MKKEKKEANEDRNKLRQGHTKMRMNEQEEEADKKNSMLDRGKLITKEWMGKLHKNKGNDEHRKRTRIAGRNNGVMRRKISNQDRILKTY